MELLGTKSQHSSSPYSPVVLFEAEAKDGFGGLILENRSSESLKETITAGTWAPYKGLHCLSSITLGVLVINNPRQVVTIELSVLY